ncbi:MAG: RAD55 family ATPase [Candidatus Asgardarchaeia archaeon]
MEAVAIPSNFIESLVGLLKGGPQLVLVKGEPGTGKTTFAFTLLKSLKLYGSIAYFAAREELRKIELYAPELLQELPREYIFQIKNPRYISVVKKQDAIKYLGFEGKHPLMRIIFDICDTSERAFVVIDSIDAIREELESDESLTDFIKDLTELGILKNVSYILVSESSKVDTKLDYFADVIILLKRRYVQNRLVRELQIVKNKFNPIFKSFLLFTIINHRVITVHLDKKRIFPSDIATRKTAYPIKHFSHELFFTGINVLDNKILGGIKKGSVLLFGIDTKIPLPYKTPIFLAIVINFLLQNKSVYLVPPIAFNKKGFNDMLSLWVPKEKLNITYFNYKKDVSLDDLIVWDKTHENEREYLKIVILGALEQFFNHNDIVIYVEHAVSLAHKNNSLLIITAPLTSPLYEYFRHVVPYLIELHCLGSGIGLIARAPVSDVAYILQLHMDNGYPQVDLYPVY